MAPCDAHELIAKLTEENLRLTQLNAELGAARASHSVEWIEGVRSRCLYYPDGSMLDDIDALLKHVELLQRAVEWLRSQVAHQKRAGIPCVFNWLEYAMVPIPAEFAEIIKPREA